MKKILFILSLVFSTFLLSHHVLADTDTFNVNYILDGIPSGNNSYAEVKSYFQDNSSIISDMFTQMYSVYSSDYSSDYPYYFIQYFAQGPVSAPTGIQMDFFASSILPVVPYDSSNYNLPFELESSCSYNFSTSTFTGCDTFAISTSAVTFYYSSSDTGYLYANRIFFSNFDLKFSGLNTTYVGYNATNITSQRSWLLPSSAPITTMYDFFELNFLSEFDTEHYTDVNLNNFSYIVLSLKDYSSMPSPIYFQVKGQFCPTPVYNYGMNEKPSGSTEVCSPVYTDFTPVRFFVNQSDLDNHAVWYIAPLDTSIENKIKVNTSVFDISYITSENVSNPTAIIGGRSYPILPYSSLSSTTTQNTEDGYIPGQSTNVFDVSSDSNFITNLFSNPLQALSNVWTSIITMFSLIGSFIGLLPPVFQAFLFTAFSLALVIGIIKILL